MPRILHLGLGAFHRAHQAVYLQRLHDAGDRTWTLASGNIRADDSRLIEALRAAGGRYTLESIAPDGARERTTIASIGEIVPLDSGWLSFIRLGRDPQTRIISFTVTEAGYVAPPGETPLVFQVLAAILQARMERGAGPVTLMSCDNLRHNGDRTQQGLLESVRAGRDDDALAHWIQGNTAFPNTMVDRITPRPAGDDPTTVMAERYIQWVIEDRFVAGRPAWERVGAELVPDVGPYEEAKIRLLNATHSCLAWAGTLAGLAFVHEDAVDAEIRGFAHEYAAHDAIPALSPSPLDLARYSESVLDRFRNAALRDTNERIVTDSFAKLAAFVAPTIADRLARSQSIDAVAMLPALYLACLRRFAAGSLPYAYSDQSFAAESALALSNAADPVLALGSEPGLWGRHAGAPALVAALRRADERVRAFERRRLA